MPATPKNVPPRFAYVRYLKTKKLDVISLKWISNLRARDDRDFDPKQKYLMQASADGEPNMEGIILGLAETAEKMNERIESGERFHTPSEKTLRNVSDLQLRVNNGESEEMDESEVPEDDDTETWEYSSEEEEKENESPNTRKRKVATTPKKGFEQKMKSSKPTSPKKMMLKTDFMEKSRLNVFSLESGQLSQVHSTETLGFQSAPSSETRNTYALDPPASPLRANNQHVNSQTPVGNISAGQSTPAQQFQSPPSLGTPVTPPLSIHQYASPRTPLGNASAVSSTSAPGLKSPSSLGSENTNAMILPATPPLINYQYTSPQIPFGHPSAGPLVLPANPLQTNHQQVNSQTPVDNISAGLSTPAQQFQSPPSLETPPLPIHQYTSPRTPLGIPSTVSSTAALAPGAASSLGTGTNGTPMSTATPSPTNYQNASPQPPFVNSSAGPSVLPATPLLTNHQPVSLGTPSGNPSAGPSTAALAPQSPSSLGTGSNGTPFGTATPSPNNHQLDSSRTSDNLSAGSSPQADPFEEMNFDNFENALEPEIDNQVPPGPDQIEIVELNAQQGDQREVERPRGQERAGREAERAGREAERAGREAERAGGEGPNGLGPIGPHPELYGRIGDMIYLGADVYMDAEAWEVLLCQEKDSIFIIDLAMAVFGERELMLSAFDVKGLKYTEIPGLDGQVGPICKEKLAIIKREFKIRLKKRKGLNALQREKLMRQINGIIGRKRRDVIARFKSRNAV